MKLIKRQYDESYYNNILYREQPDSPRNKTRLACLLKQRSSGSLLEIGCGTGGFLRLAEGSFAVTGVDISAAAVESMRAHFGERVSVLNVEQRPLPKPIEGYDVIVVFNILEHLRQPQRVVEKLHHALTPGGLLIGSVPNNQSAIGSLNTRLGNFFDRTHISTFTPPTWRRIFQHAGFQSINFFGEVTLGRNRCRYLSGPLWPHLSFNLMFTCEKLTLSDHANRN